MSVTKVKSNSSAASDIKTPSVIGHFSGKCCDSNVFNNNDMHLGPEVFKTLIASDEYKRAMQNRHYIGFCGHPENPDCQDYEHACIVMTDMKLLDNGEVEGTFDLVNTPVGNVVKSFIDAGVKFGISIRGVGDVDASGEVDPDQFIFRGFDLVTFPAYDDCIPEFKAIAASTDSKKKLAYKKICASIDANLQSIDSCEALAVIQEQLPEGSEEFNKVQERIDEIMCPVDEAVCEAVAEQKLEAMTQLYLDAAAKVRELEVLLQNECAQKDALVVECSTLKRKQARLDRIVANQITAANDAAASMEDKYNRSAETAQHIRASLQKTRQELAETKKSYDQEVLANSRLKERLTSLNEKRKDDQESIKASNDLNLKYQRKVEANSQAISQKDSEIEKLKTQLSETVAASKKLEAKASNLDEKNGELLSRVEAAEEMVSSYQQAYANMYANALGVYLTGLPVTASTTVDELKQMISGGTSTANIAAAPSYTGYDEDEYEDEEESEDILDDTQYGADLVTM